MESKITERWIYPPHTDVVGATGGPEERVKRAIEAYRKLGGGEHQMEVQGGMAEIVEIDPKTKAEISRETKAVCVWIIDQQKLVLVDREAIVVACGIEAECIMNDVPEEEYGTTVKGLRRACECAQEALERGGAAVN